MQSPIPAIAAVIAAALAVLYTAAPSFDAPKGIDAAKPAVAAAPLAKPPADADPEGALEKLLDDYLLTPSTQDGRAPGESPAGTPASSPSVPISQKLTVKGHTVKSLIVMVPDPGDTSFDFRYDQILDAVQRSTVAAGYLVTSFSNPWDDYKVREANWRAGRTEAKTPPTHTCRSHPAYVLSRKADKHKELLVTMLVGESPTAGVQRKALAAALDSVERLNPSGGRVESVGTAVHPEASTIRVVGPNFSGSQSSLEAVLLDWKSRGADKTGRKDWKFRVVSGSANGLADIGREIQGSLLNENLTGPGEISRTLVANHILMSAAVLYLAKRDESRTAERIERDGPGPATAVSRLRGKVAILREGNTGFGFGAKSLTGVIDLPFPLHVAQLRASFDLAQVKRGKELEVLAEDPLTPILVQDAAAEPAADRITPQDPRTTAALNGVNMLEITRTLRQEQVKYVGIVTTDIRDALFLSGLLKQYCPDVVQFTTNSERMVTLPQYQYAARGLIVASTYPLIPHVSNWSPRLVKEEVTREVKPATDRRNNFSSQASQATYNAVLAQLNSKKLMADYGPPNFLRPAGTEEAFRSRPPIWISVVSPSGQFVPLQAFSNYVDPHMVTRAENEIGGYDGMPSVRMPKSFPFLLAGSWAVWVSLTCAYFRRRPRNHPVHWWGGGQRLYEFVGLFSQATLYVALSKVAALHFRVDDTSAEGDSLGSGMLVSANLLVGLVFSAAFGKWVALCWGRLPAGYQPAKLNVAVAAGVAWQVAMLVTMSNRHGLFTGTEPGAADVLFLERATNLSGWFSPLMPLAFLAAAGLAWAWLQTRQIDWVVRFSLDSPLPKASAPAAESAAGELRRWLTAYTGNWWATAVAVAVAVAVLGVVVEAGYVPTDEGFRWDAFFFGSFAAGVFLGGLFVARFVQFWVRLKAVLRAWALLPIAGAFERLPEPVREVFGGYLFTRRPRHSDLTILRRQVGLLRLELEADARRGAKGQEVLAAVKRHFPNAGTGDAEPRSDDWPGESRNRFSALAADLAAQLQPHWDKRGIDATYGHAAPAPADAPAAGPPDPAKTPPEPGWVRLAEEVVAAQGLAYLGQYFLQLRGRVWGLAVGPVLLLMAVTSYPFHPAQFLLLVDLGLIAAALAAMLWVVVDVTRDPVVTRLARAGPGRGRLDTSALGHVLQYVVPVVGVVAAQLSGSLRAVFEPLLHVLR